MFDPNSRYFSLETATIAVEEVAAQENVLMHQEEIAYKRRRFLPQGRELALALEYRVQQGDRLDLISVRTLGDPEQYWQIADANDAMNPNDLTTEPGRVIRIPNPQI